MGNEAFFDRANWRSTFFGNAEEKRDPDVINVTLPSRICQYFPFMEILRHLMLAEDNKKPPGAPPGGGRFDQ